MAKWSSTKQHDVIDKLTPQQALEILKRLSEKKEESRSLLQGGGAQPQGPPKAEEKIMPVKSERVAGRNDKVTVQYPDGRVLKDVKFKKVEDDVKAGRCIVIEG